MNHYSELSGRFFRLSSDSVLRQTLAAAVEFDGLSLFAQGLVIDYNLLNKHDQDVACFCDKFVPESVLGFDCYQSPYLEKAMPGISGDWTVCIGLRSKPADLGFVDLTWRTVKFDCVFYVACIDSAFWVGYFKYSEFKVDDHVREGVIEISMQDFEKWIDA